MNPTKEDNVYLARVSEQLERYKEMLEYVGKFIKSDGELTADERNIISVAYKNIVGARRAELRVLTAIESKEEKKGSTTNVGYIQKYKAVIEEELKGYCNDIIGYLDKYLIPKATSSSEAKVFFLKMRGDYHRYLCEFVQGPEYDESYERAVESYQQARKVADDSLPPTHPVRLGLYLNLSVFIYEFVRDPDKACELAKNAFDRAVENIDNVNEETYKECTMIMQLLRDNLTLWSQEFEQAPQGGKDEQ